MTPNPDQMLPPLAEWLRPKGCANAAERWAKYGPMIAVRFRAGHYVSVDPWSVLDHVIHGGVPAGVTDPVHWRGTHLPRGNEPFPVIIASGGWKFVRGDLREAIVEAFVEDADLLTFREVPDGECDHQSCRARKERMARYTR